ncbi:sugar transferase [Megalodesulfovibrio gigas]|uniref:Putative sugar transferase n=1 Tax=Megalodesulfovibrio gigas (strain ATCC 19364 / DSM 1382 / NCIMB 9332 / VKM B-1759) TaxID=1121448 RepID=T2GC39_MEGG1|nr:sugar transferase [Megalodesulfovibrio gigas]AGW13739.1 putative sugar transferase [Megalodesulfovibrio gigas DSM 1382 = ATCC 19364]
MQPYAPVSQSARRPFATAQGVRQFGYSRGSFLSITLFNMVLSSVMLLAALPIMVVIAIAIKLRDGGPVLYFGSRMGLGGKPFKMIKFRTLPVGADKLIGGELLSHQHKLTTPFSKLLRDTRLDELPQLVNVLKGDMDFVGPRPERPEVYAKLCKQIPNYEQRFMVRPGLIGYAQLFTPHSCPKRIRAFIDNKYVHLKRSIIWDLIIVVFTGVVLTRSVFVKGGAYFWRNAIRAWLLKDYMERRELERVTQRHASLCMRVFSDTSELCLGDFTLVDMNEECLKIYSDVDLEDQSIRIYRLGNVSRRLGKKKRKRCTVMGEVVRKRELPDAELRFVYIIRYKPISQLNQYLVDQYFLHKSIV